MRVSHASEKTQQMTDDKKNGAWVEIKISSVHTEITQ